jgi:hypothetical protein
MIKEGKVWHRRAAVSSLKDLASASACLQVPELDLTSATSIIDVVNAVLL